MADQIPKTVKRNGKGNPLRETGWMAYKQFADEYGEGMVVFDNENPHTVITSKSKSGCESSQYPVIDIDGGVRMVPSTTPGHFHMFIDKECTWYDYVTFLQAAVKIGLVEPGFAEASINRGYTCVWAQEY